MPSATIARSANSAPSSSPTSMSSERSSTYCPAKGFSMTAIAAARRVGGLTARPISVRVSSTTVTSLRMRAFIKSPSCCGGANRHLRSTSLYSSFETRLSQVGCCRLEQYADLGNTRDQCAPQDGAVLLPGDSALLIVALGLFLGLEVLAGLLIDDAHRQAHLAAIVEAHELDFH